MRRDPFLDLRDMLAFLRDKFLGERLDLGVVRGVENGLVIV